MLRAVTGLEGGAVASGSTCGVITGGALGLGLMHEAALSRGGISAQAALLQAVGDYMDWFRNEVGPTTCRERSGVDFYKVRGQLRYLLPGDRVARCLSHIWKAVNFLTSFGQKELIPTGDDNQPTMPSTPIHCAQSVLMQVRERIGVGDPLLERVAVAFDGGVGLRGGLCGALAGALMALNLVHGMDVRQAGFTRAVRGFVIGHLNLLLKHPKGVPEPFAIGKTMVQAFRCQADSIECRAITKLDFGNWNGFQDHVAASKPCQELIAFCADLACNAIENSRLE